MTELVALLTDQTAVMAYLRSLQCSRRIYLWLIPSAVRMMVGAGKMPSHYRAAARWVALD